MTRRAGTGAANILISGERVREYREDSGLSQAQLAEKIGLSRSAIAALENRNPARVTQNTFDRIVSVSEFDPKDLLYKKPMVDEGVAEIGALQFTHVDVGLAGKDDFMREIAASVKYTERLVRMMGDRGY